jgi:hypothetical protein
MSRNVTIKGSTMAGEGDEKGEERGHGALVPLTPTLERLRNASPCPDPGFVTQLIATAEHVPQTSALRRGSPRDARAAYAERRVPPSGRTRQLI